ncbi:hypothetical protein KI387_009772, partial [Taxus chinensis]
GPRDSWDVRDAWDAKSRNGRKWKKSSSFCFRAVWDIQDKSTRGTRIGRFRRQIVHFGWFGDICPRQSIGTKVHEGRKGEKLGDFTQIRLGQWDMGREKLKKPQTGTRKPESAEAGDFHPGQLGQSTCGTRGTRKAEAAEGKEEKST